ncbi:hypothetical protein T492DRAFT_971571 [Pavlovales sp. CCMP2436]|nr:hypothetical protein T492DRAFT_971571 [Pavlovales sp. CCMP2436]
MCIYVRDLKVAHVVLVLPRPVGADEPEGDPAYAHLFHSARKCKADSDGQGVLDACEGEVPLLHIARTVDAAVAWCEDRILQTAGSEGGSGLFTAAQSNRSLAVYWIDQSSTGSCLLPSFKSDLYHVMPAFDEAGERQQVDEPGCMLGEFGLITGEHRQNTVTALSPCTLYELSRSQWEHMQEEKPRLAFVLTSVALKYTGNRLRQVAFSAHQSSAVPV